MLISENSPTALIRLMARLAMIVRNPTPRISSRQIIVGIPLTLLAANLDPVYPDPTPGGYKGKLQCGIYKVSRVSSTVMRNTYFSCDSQRMLFPFHMVGKNRTCPHTINKGNAMSKFIWGIWQNLPIRSSLLTSFSDS